MTHEEILPAITRRRCSDLLLFGVTAAELAALIVLTPGFTLVEWVYVAENLLVLGLAVTRRAATAQDHSLPTSIAVAASYAYPYAQVIVLDWTDGYVVSP